MKGINLGGWFVLEGWMNRPLFEGVDPKCHDETCFTLQKENAQEALYQHYDTWITREDIIWLKKQKFDFVRIPVPWWLFGEDGYVRSVEILDQKLQMINELEMDFMIDLHTAPGCQNGFDNGGLEGVLTWHLKQSNLDKTKEILSLLMQRYDYLKHFKYIQLLNEPHVSIDMHLLQMWYLDTYHALRCINKERIIVFHDGFRINAWKDFFTKNNFNDVILDTHMYQCFDDEVAKLDIKGHEQKAIERKHIIKEIQHFVPLMIGEWSLGLRHNENDHTPELEKLNRYYKAQVKGMKEAYAHVFWSYKLITNAHSGWHFRQLVDNQTIF